MNQEFPIYTVKTECQDCYKCVRGCPVKAIKVVDGHASVRPELCIACGNCVETCPAKAKKVRNDLPRVKILLKQDNPVYASLAPSWVSEFRGIKDEQMIAALKKLGFTGVGETALGAELVSAKTAEQLAEKGGLTISSACPAAVDYLRRFQPEFATAMTGIYSPALAHCKMLREEFGNDIKTVFIGPCIAKKNEADRNPDLLNITLTFDELRAWLKEENINLYQVVPTKEDKFVLGKAANGALYPVEGGMIGTIKDKEKLEKVHFAELTGIPAMEQALAGLRPEDVKETVFIETLACRGGCVHGPCCKHDSPGLLERLRIFGRTQQGTGELKQNPDITTKIEASPEVEHDACTMRDLRQALQRVGKFNPEDELNCGGCGYNTCRKFAEALIEEKAEPCMCVSYLRKQAQKKANALLRCIPSGVVIVGPELKIIECNQRFAATFGEDTVAAFDALPGLAGADLKRIVPFSDLFVSCLENGQDIHRDSLRVDNKLLSVTVFSIELHEAVGAVMFDVTSTELRREQIAARAKEVIDRNVAAVQEIACLLGENMADTEILLRSIAEDYADEN
jgi:iron only hydrogenase large subunit-like protein